MDMDFDSNDPQVINPNLGLKLANNKPELAESLLKMLVDELPEMKTNILEAYAKKDHESLSKAVHKLHGGCCYCGVPRMKSAASMLESILKTGSSEPEAVDILVKALISEIGQVMACYEESYQS